MEPLDVMATDWIKDYDPLFDLFDEEMRAGAQAAAAAEAATWQHHHHHHQASCCNTGDYYHALTSADYDLNQYYYPTCKPQQTDELSIILGLDWMPTACLNEFNSPTESSSAYSSSVPSPATSSTCGSNNLGTSVSAPLIRSTNCNNNKLNCNNSTNGSSSSSSNSNSNSNNNNKSKLGNNNINPTLSQQTNCSTQKKRKKRCLQAKGTSLLAQPSPKLTNIYNSANSSYSSFTTTSSLSPASSRSNTTLATTTIMINNTQTNTDSTSRTNTEPTTMTATRKTRLLDLDKTTRLCARIEHAYAAVQLI